MSAVTLAVRVAARWAEAEDIAGIELVADDGAELPAFSAGSHIDVHLPGGLTRSYSLCNPSSERHRYSLGVLKELAGRGGSQAVHASLQVGSALSISPPRNAFPLREDAPSSLLLAGGIGITPILCMAHRLHELGSDFRLHYAARSRRRAAFVEHLEGSAFSHRVSLQFDDAAGGMTVGDAVAQATAATEIYVCGPAGFIDHVYALARERGIEGARLHREYFAAPKGPATGDAFHVRLARRGIELPVPAGRTLLEVLRDADVEVPTSCEVGVCGACMTRVLNGQPDHRDEILSEGERSSGEWITPCCSRSLTPVLVLDL